jgi:tetratricopeptide (TPR) repeat protein
MRRSHDNPTNISLPSPRSERGGGPGRGTKPSRNRPHLLTSIAHLLPLLLALFAGNIHAADSDDAEFLAGLRNRQLFQLAEDYCMGQLKREELSDVRRSEMVAELSVTLVDRALYASPEERDDYWRRAWEVTDQFADSHPDHPRLLLVQAQGALAQVTRGELGRQEAEVLADGERRREQARDLLRDALRTLNELAEQVDDALRERSMPGRQQSETPGELTRYQLATLQKQIRYQTARALRNQALCYPDDSPDRANALTQAIDLLDGLAKLGPKEPLAWTSRVDEIVCLRLLKNYDGAARNLEVAKTLEPNSEMSGRLAAEQIRLALASGDLGAAVREANQIRGMSTPELDLARLEAALAAQQAADAGEQADVAQQWQKAAMALRDQITQRHGPYWSRRAKSLLASAFKTATDTDSLEMSAENAYLSGQFDEALAIYDKAAAMARQQNDTTRAFHNAFLAATIQRERAKHAEALRRYRELATAHAANAKAAEAHQLAIQQAAEIARSGEPGTFDAYVDLLREHVQYWPKDASTDAVRWQLARVYQSQARWADAIEVYQQITPDFDRFEQVIQAVRRCYQNRISEGRTKGEAIEPIAMQAGRWFESLVLGPNDRPPERWSPVARQAVLAAAEFRLQDKTQLDRAEALLKAALSGPTDAPDAWRSAAQSLLVCVLAGQERRMEAAALLDQISDVSKERLLAVLEGLARLSEGAEPKVRRELANLQLRTIELLDPPSNLLTADQLLTLNRLTARAQRDAGRTADALAAYEQLAQQYPNDGTIREELASMLMVANDRRSVERALTLWRTIEKRSPTATPRWFRAKYSIALLHYRLGNPQQARKMITLLQVLHPELGGPKLKADFLALLKQCGG